MAGTHYFKHHVIVRVKNLLCALYDRSPLPQGPRISGVLCTVPVGTQNAWLPACRMPGLRRHGRSGYYRMESHPTIAVAVVILNVSERCSSSSVGLWFSINLTSIFTL